jgi:hypothetical protein
VIYRIEVGAERLLILRRDEQIVCVSHGVPALLAELLYDLTERLSANCRTHLVFHAAGLARGDSGLIACGESGSGKSTLAAWLTACGFDFLSDELVAVAPDLRRMSGLARPISLKPGSAFVWERWLDESLRQSLSRLPDESLLLDPEWLRPGCVCASASPRCVLFPSYVAGAALVVRRLTAAEALFRLMHRLINTASIAGQGFAEATCLAQQLTAYALTYGDVAQAAAWLADWGFDSISQSPAQS